MKELIYLILGIYLNRVLRTGTLRLKRKWRQYTCKLSWKTSCRFFEEKKIFEIGEENKKSKTLIINPKMIIYWTSLFMKFLSFFWSLIPIK